MIIPNTQQSMLLLCLSLAVLGFFLGIEVQKRRLGSMGALASTINIIVLDNPMTFHFSQFLDSALGQIVGCMLAFIVIMLVRDNSRDRTGRVLLNQFVSAAVSAMTTNVVRRKENHLPALYQQLFLLMNKFPGDLGEVSPGADNDHRASAPARCAGAGKRRSLRIPSPASTHCRSRDFRRK